MLSCPSKIAGSAAVLLASVQAPVLPGQTPFDFSFLSSLLGCKSHHTHTHTHLNLSSGSPGEAHGRARGRGFSSPAQERRYPRSASPAGENGGGLTWRVLLPQGEAGASGRAFWREPQLPRRLRAPKASRRICEGRSSPRGGRAARQFNKRAGG